jgi:hypothetical protein
LKIETGKSHICTARTMSQTDAIDDALTKCKVCDRSITSGAVHVWGANDDEFDVCREHIDLSATFTASTRGGQLEPFWVPTNQPACIQDSVAAGILQDGQISTGFYTAIVVGCLRHGPFNSMRYVLRGPLLSCSRVAYDYDVRFETSLLVYRKRVAELLTERLRTAGRLAACKIASIIVEMVAPM